MTPHARGMAMREIALRPEFFDELGDVGWLDGGCAIYADAAWAYLQGDGAVIAHVIAEGPAWGPIVDHSVVICGDTVYDGDGATRLEGFLATYAAREGRQEAVLELLEAHDVEDDPELRGQAGEFRRNARLSARLAQAWVMELGTVRRSAVPSPAPGLPDTSQPTECL